VTWFFTELDPRAKIAGSRDPLGFQQHWTALGRELVSTLTTVTRSVRGFTTLMLGLQLADELIREGAPEESRASSFLKFEQLAGYARVIEHKASPLGSQRIKKRLSEAKGIPLGTGSDGMILADQRTYGLWGLYSASSRESGLIERYEHRPTGTATEHLQGVVLPRANKKTPHFWDKVRRIVSGDLSTWYPQGRHSEITDALGAALSPRLRKAEKDFYWRSLVVGESAESSHSRQRALWELMEEVNESGPFSWSDELGRDEVLELARRAGVRHEQVADSLQAILVLDPFFGMCSRLFSMLLQASGERAQLLETLRQQEEAFDAIDPEAVEVRRARLGDGATADRLIALARALRSRAHPTVMDLLLEHNAAVMRARGGSAWGELRGDRLEVRLRPERLAPPSEIDVRSQLFYPYFLLTLKSVGGHVIHGQAS
jgi:hypothetical protein